LIGFDLTTGNTGVEGTCETEIGVVLTGVTGAWEMEIGVFGEGTFGEETGLGFVGEETETVDLLETVFFSDLACESFEGVLVGETDTGVLGERASRFDILSSNPSLLLFHLSSNFSTVSLK
jgi:hypothetical protein